MAKETPLLGDFFDDDLSLLDTESNPSPATALGQNPLVNLDVQDALASGNRPTKKIYEAPSEATLQPMTNELSYPGRGRGNRPTSSAETASLIDRKTEKLSANGRTDRVVLGERPTLQLSRDGERMRLGEKSRGEAARDIDNNVEEIYRSYVERLSRKKFIEKVKAEKSLLEPILYGKPYDELVGSMGIDVLDHLLETVNFTPQSRNAENSHFLYRKRKDPWHEGLSEDKDDYYYDNRRSNDQHLNDVLTSWGKVAKEYSDAAKVELNAERKTQLLNAALTCCQRRLYLSRLDLEDELKSDNKGFPQWKTVLLESLPYRLPLDNIDVIKDLAKVYDLQGDSESRDIVNSMAIDNLAFATSFMEDSIKQVKDYNGNLPSIHESLHEGRLAIGREYLSASRALVDFYLSTGHKDKALRTYNQALYINTNFLERDATSVSYEGLDEYQIEVLNRKIESDREITELHNSIRSFLLESIKKDLIKEGISFV
jgi:hypothetical protein